MKAETTDRRGAQIVRTLNTCIETCIAGEKGYAAAAADVRDPVLKERFRRYAAERAAFVSALQEEIERLGAFAENQGTARAAAHRGLMSARIALEGRTDAVILGECERGEQAALFAYDREFARTPLDTMPIEIRKILVEQRAAIRSAYDDLVREDVARRRARQH